ncbi:Aste57867_7926 [Aphanomyces stellatus]|uniref:Aste57867_7926 protein n=1 Tax=Aphanomyces stellatus TaxID=120398 RepID=A0A485KJ06_9STRA|nr:hypothetical protein As57867_007896 [Aphanomyces stellatus]VFT84819.1 Aste57867_7926 [Aphanomyces stellatus]
MHMRVLPAATDHAPKLQLVGTSSSSLRWLRLFIMGFALLKHTICALYLVAQVLIFHKLDRAQTQSAHAYALPQVTLVYILLAATHGASILHALCRTPGLRRASTQCLDPKNRRVFAWLLKWATHKRALAAYNIIELGCQTFEAFELATKLVDHTLVAIFVVVVAVHALVAPWVLCVYHPTPRLILLNWFSSLLSFHLSCIVHIVGFIVPILRYLLIDTTANRDPLWLTRNVLYARYNFVTSPLDFAAKTILQLGSLISIWRLMASIDLANVLLRHGHRLSTFNITSNLSLPRTLRLYWLMSTLWGLVLVVSLVHALYGRQSCPATCVAYANPLWTTHCQCMFVHVNCHDLGHDDVDAALQVSQIGSGVFALLVSRCNLTNGIDNTTLNQFESLYYIGIKFTNMITWTGQLPPTIYYVVVEYGALTHVPDILRSNVGPFLTAVGLNNHPMTSLVIPDVWNYKVLRLSLNNVSLRVVPGNITSLGLNYLFLQQNQLTTLPSGMDQMTSLTYLDASANSFDHGPWLLLKPKTTLLLCDNPLATTDLPASIDPGLWQTYLQASNAACAPLCSLNCFPYLVGDHTCHLACFNAACNYDGGDCDVFGFDRPR